MRRSSRPAQLVCFAFASAGVACTAILGATDVPPAGESSADATLRDASDAKTDTRPRDATRDSPSKPDRTSPEATPPEASVDANGRDARSDVERDAGTDADAAPTDSGHDAVSLDAPARDSGHDSAPAVTYRTVVLNDEPLAYWRLGETSGTTAKDETGHYDGTYAGDFTLGEPGAIEGDVNTSVSLNPAEGQTGYIDVGGTFATASAFEGAAAFTLEAWIKPTSVNTEYRSVLSRETMLGDGKQGYTIYVGGFTSNGTGVGFSRFENGSENHALDASVVSADGAWYHVVGVYTGATTELYVNGGLAASRPDSLLIQSFTCSFNIGASHCGTEGFFQGYMDEVAVYAKALSATQIGAHYAAGK